MRILVIGQAESTLALLHWLQRLKEQVWPNDLISQAAASCFSQLAVSHTNQATEAMAWAREGGDIIFLDLITPEIPAKTNLAPFRQFEPDERAGAWLLHRLKMGRYSQPRVGVITTNIGRIRQLCRPWGKVGLLAAPIEPRTFQWVQDHLIEIHQAKS
ncbi:MAG: hypothetical protein WCX71_05800 [Candidatus Buchananbacteria bacterium]